MATIKRNGGSQLKRETTTRDLARVEDALGKRPVDPPAVREGVFILGELIRRDGRTPGALLAALVQVPRLFLRQIAVDAGAEVASWSLVDSEVIVRRELMESVRHALLRIELARAESGDVYQELKTLQHALASFDKSGKSGRTWRSMSEETAGLARHRDEDPSTDDSAADESPPSTSEVIEYIARGRRCRYVEDYAARHREFESALLGHIEALLAFKQPVSLVARRFLMARCPDSILPPLVSFAPLAK